jgi:hypothetical protein
LNAVLKISIFIKSGIPNTIFWHEHPTLLGSTQIHKNRCVWFLSNPILHYIFYLQKQANS